VRTVEIAISRYAERILNKIVEAINETFVGLEWMLQEFRMYYTQNPKIKALRA